MTDTGPPTYTEPARSYSPLWIVVAFFAAGMVLDAVLGGFVTHLIGWLLAFALVGGAFFLFIYAARAEKSLHLTADELRIGDEVLPRQSVVGLAEGGDDTELPVLGWPAGGPPGLKTVTVRLDDGRDVAVPTRFPARLVAALGVSAVPGVHQQEVRAAAQAEFALLVEIDERAETLFRTAGYQLPPVPWSTDDLARAAAVFVAGRPPVGFVRVDVVDGLAHVSQIAVIPKWMRQGVGTRLLERACEWAREQGYPAITLTAYADVPWNGPYFSARGFVEVTDEVTGYGPELAALREREVEQGLDEVGRRIVLRRELA